MDRTRLSEDLGAIKECDFVRTVKEGKDVAIFVVGDNEKDEADEDECCEGLNGHLFKLVFRDVSDYAVEGEESDSYVLLSSDVRDGRVDLTYQGTSFDGTSGKLRICFEFKKYDVVDLGKIEGPDA